MASRNVFPGGSLVRALLHRPLMVLADRGGASGTVGDRWGDHCAAHLGALEPGAAAPRRLALPGGEVGPAARVVCLDTIPGINRFASQHSLSNPDFLVELHTPDGRVLTAADAKFSVETARAKQVSVEIVSALIAAPESPVAPLVDVDAPRADGLFLSPDFPLTHEVLAGRFGIGRLSVRRAQVHLVHATGADLFDHHPTRRYVDAFAALDGYAGAWRGDLMLGLFGHRCGAAAVGCWQDEVRPLLGPPTESTADVDRVLAEIDARAATARTGWELVQRWDADAEVVRGQRVALNRAAQLPVPTRDLRALIEAEAARVGINPPSVNFVRRHLADLTRDRLVREHGVLRPPLDGEGRTLAAVSRSAARLARTVPEDVARIVASLRPGSEAP